MSHQKNNSLRYVFFGTPDIAAQSLALLCDAGMPPALVVTAPATPQGRGMHLTNTPVAVLARALNIPCLTPEKITPSVRADIAAMATGADSNAGWDFFLVVAYAKILPQSLLDSVNGRVLNVHPSLLPLYRGPSPLESVLFSDDAATGVTLMELDAEIDHGPLVAQVAWPLAEETTLEMLTEQSARAGAELLKEAIADYLAGTLQPTAQDHAMATHTRKFSKSDGDITALRVSDPDANDVANQRAQWHVFRALGNRGWVSFTTEHRGSPVRIKITAAHFDGQRFIIDEAIPENKKPMHAEALQHWLQS